MFYPLLRSFVKFGLHWYVTDWQLKNLDYADQKNPSLIVSNHPNSFFDALVIAVHSSAEIRFLTRGDIFEKPWANWLLRNLFMIPIYKSSDGEDAEVKNAFSIDACIKELQAGNRILIFPEGRSRNHIGLQPFMPKGIKMLVNRAIQMDVPIQIQSYIVGYSSFNDIPKAVYFEALSPIDCTNYISNGEVDIPFVMQGLRDKMELSMPESMIAPNPNTIARNQWMNLPAKLGFYSHNWYYQLIKKQVKKKTEGTIFFDSLMFATLLFTYPLLIFLISYIVGYFLGFWPGFLIFLILPFLSYCWVNYKPVKVDTEILTDRVNQLNQPVKPL